MKKCNQVSLLWLSLSLLFIFIACTKQGLSLISKTKIQQAADEGATMQHFFFNNVTIDSSRKYIFSIPAVTQAIIDSGSVIAYASDETEQWHSLPLINGCSLRLDVTALTKGNVEIQNNLGVSVTLSYRFDITAAQ
jgi:hypothetical protein